MTPCQTCNASHKNTVERVIRCCTCKVQPVGMPTKYKASHGITASVAEDSAKGEA